MRREVKHATQLFIPTALEGMHRKLERELFIGREVTLCVHTACGKEVAGIGHSS